jgi:hypothetical protein
MLLLTIALLFDFVRDLSAALRGLTPALGLVASFVFLLAGFSSTVFLHVFLPADILHLHFFSQ